MTENLKNGGKGSNGGKRWRAGRPPKEQTIIKKSLAEKYHNEPEKCIRVLIAMRDNPTNPPAIVLGAISEMMDRLVGKPSQSFGINPESNKLIIEFKV